MGKTSAGILMFRKLGAALQVLLVHPGGPIWKNKDAGAWSIPKGEYGRGEDPLTVAKREMREETGIEVGGEFIPLGEVVQSNGKVVTAWAVQGDWLPTEIQSNTFSMEWPPKSGRQQEFPEVDRAEWFGVAEARRKLIKAQVALIDRLVQHAETGKTSRD